MDSIDLPYKFAEHTEIIENNLFLKFPDKQSCWKIKKILGETNASIVLKIQTENGIFALKCMPFESARNEGSLLFRLLDCPHVLNIHSIIVTPNNNKSDKSDESDGYLLMENLDEDYSTLSSFQHQIILNNEQEISIQIFFSLLSGLKEIHNAGIVHGDIKPQNIMLHSKTHKCKLIDLGLGYARGTKKTRGYMTTITAIDPAILPTFIIKNG